MKAKIAVATVSGKAYYLIVNELKSRRIPFLSLTPTEPIPIEIKAVITTRQERGLVKHERVLTYNEDTDPKTLIHEALQISEGKEYYEKIIVGVDPGEVFGLAVLADGKVIETGTCFSAEETSEKIVTVLGNLQKNAPKSVSVKVGDGVPAYMERLLRILDNALPLNVKLESVSEAGTDKYLSENSHRRGLRDIVSAMRIAGRSGHVYSRGKTNDSNS